MLQFWTIPHTLWERQNVRCLLLKPFMTALYNWSTNKSYQTNDINPAGNTPFIIRTLTPRKLYTLFRTR